MTSVLLVLRLSIVTIYMVHVMIKMSCNDGQRAHDCFAAIINETNTPEGYLTTSVKRAATTSGYRRNEVRWQVFKQYARLSPRLAPLAQRRCCNHGAFAVRLSATQTRPYLWT